MEDSKILQVQLLQDKSPEQLEIEAKEWTKEFLGIHYGVTDKAVYMAYIAGYNKALNK